MNTTGRRKRPAGALLAVIAPLNGFLAPVALPSPDGRQLAYNTWTELRRVEPGGCWSDQGIKPGDPLGVPSLRLRDLGDLGRVDSVSRVYGGPGYGWSTRDNLLHVHG